MAYDLSTRGYFNAASHGVPAASVYEAMTQALADEARLGPDGAAQAWAGRSEGCRADVAQLLGAGFGDIGFSSTTTTGLYALLAHMDLSGKRVLVTPHEWGTYHRVLAARSDLRVEVLPEIDLENPDLSAWAARIDEDVAAIFAPMVTSICGAEYPVRQIGALPRPAHTKFVIDAAQAVGQMPVNVAEIGCDALVSTARKWLRGPRQSSFIWMNEGWAFQGAPLTARGLEAADQNLMIRAGLSAALRGVLEEGIENVQAGILTKSNAIRLKAVEAGLPVLAGHTGTVSIELGSGGMADFLAQYGIAAKTPVPRNFEPLVAQWQGMARVLRISPHVYTTDDDLDQVFGLMEALAIETGVA